VIDYVDAWIERARQNGGLLPDNVGLSGQIGEHTGGKWYGGLYGWTWPHGFYNIAMAAIVAGANAYLLTQDSRYLDLPRTQIDRVLELGEVRDLTDLPMSLRGHWIGQREAFAAGTRPETLVVPYRYGDAGWFDYQPMAPMYPTAVWSLSLLPEDWARLERLRQASRYDWNLVLPFRTKEDAGHEPPWLRFLAGANPGYPEAILAESCGQVYRRLDQIRADQADLREVHIHHWQQHNPVLTEALIQLTLGAPPPVYNGGLLFAPLRHFDPVRRRPGLPEDVAALVTKVGANGVELCLVNLSPVEARSVVVQAGAFGEHRFDTVRYTAHADAGSHPDRAGSYAPPDPVPEQQRRSLDGLGGNGHLRIDLPPGTEITLGLEMTRFVNQPSYALPWDG
jgi:hypothetical protein